MRKITKKFYNNKNDMFGLPQIYKGVEFYPIKLKDFEAQSLYYKIFQYPKDFISQKEIIKASYLKFLLIYINSQWSKDLGESLDVSLIRFLEIITKHDDDVYIGFSDVSLEISIKIGVTVFTEQEFEVIREIILNQNGSSVEYVEEYHPELEKVLQYSSRKFSNLSLEDEIWAFCSIMHKTIHEIEDYTLYQFNKHFERLILSYNHNLYSPLEISGQIKSKNGSEIIKHFLSPIDKKGRYSSILVSTDAYLTEHPEMVDGGKLGNV